MPNTTKQKKIKRNSFRAKRAPKGERGGFQLLIAYTFTTKSRAELLKDVPKVIQPRVLRGEVVPGMNQAQVLLAYGPPPAIRTPDRRNESWIYWIGKHKTVRLVFRGDKVRNIININQN